MMDTLRAKILRLLDENRIMTLAALRPDGWPQATTVGYANDGLRLYFVCGPHSQKAENLTWDDRVSLTIGHDVAEPLAIRGLSMAARAARIGDGQRIRRVFAELMPKKYPEFVGLIDNVDLNDVAAFEVTPQIISVIDYSLGFGHADLVTVAPADL